VIVGGGFSTAGGVPASNIARYSPATNTWSALGAGTDSGVRALAVLPGGDLVAGGGFTLAGGVVSAYFARYTFGSTCRADFDCSGVPNVDDLFIYLNAWFALDPRADVSTPADGVNVDDIFIFLNLWFAGC
jgi:hypothetical protein